MANPPHKAERRNLLLQPTSSTGSTPRFNATTSQVTLGHPALVRHEQLLKSKSNLEPQKGYSSKNLRTKKPHQSQSLSFPTQGMWIPIPTGSNSPCRGPKQTGPVTKERARVHGSHQKYLDSTRDGSSAGWGTTVDAADEKGRPRDPPALTHPEEEDDGTVPDPIALAQTPLWRSRRWW